LQRERFFPPFHQAGPTAPNRAHSKPSRIGVHVCSFVAHLQLERFFQAFSPSRPHRCTTAPILSPLEFVFMRVHSWPICSWNDFFPTFSKPAPPLHNRAHSKPSRIRVHACSFVAHLQLERFFHAFSKPAPPRTTAPIPSPLGFVFMRVHSWPICGRDDFFTPSPSQRHRCTTAPIPKALWDSCSCVFIRGPFAAGTIFFAHSHRNRQLSRRPTASCCQTRTIVRPARPDLGGS
jgi:hypothetical protein